MVHDYSDSDLIWSLLLVAYKHRAGMTSILLAINRLKSNSVSFLVYDSVLDRNRTIQHTVDPVSTVLYDVFVNACNCDEPEERCDFCRVALRGMNVVSRYESKEVLHHGYRNVCRVQGTHPPHGATYVKIDAWEEWFVLSGLKLFNPVVQLSAQDSVLPLEHIDMDTHLFPDIPARLVSECGSENGWLSIGTGHFQTDPDMSHEPCIVISHTESAPHGAVEGVLYLNTRTLSESILLPMSADSRLSTLVEMYPTSEKRLKVVPGFRMGAIRRGNKRAVTCSDYGQFLHHSNLLGVFFELIRMSSLFFPFRWLSVGIISRRMVEMELMRRGVVMAPKPGIDSKQQHEMRVQKRGGHILDPVLGIHGKGVELDFSGFYTQIACSLKRIPISLNRSGTFKEDGGIPFASDTVVTTVSKRLWRMREEYKDDYPSRSMAAKLASNTMLGSLGKIEWPCSNVDSYNLITSIAREKLCAAERALSTNETVSLVVGGMTDSIFVIYKDDTANPDKLMACASEAAQAPMKAIPFEAIMMVNSVCHIQMHPDNKIIGVGTYQTKTSICQEVVEKLDDIVLTWLKSPGTLAPLPSAHEIADELVKSHEVGRFAIYDKVRKKDTFHMSVSTITKVDDNSAPPDVASLNIFEYAKTILAEAEKLLKVVTGQQITTLNHSSVYLHGLHREGIQSDSNVLKMLRSLKWEQKTLKHEHP